MLCVHFVLERERERRKEGRGNSQETLPFSFTHFVILHFSFCLSFRRSMFWIYILSDQLMLQKYNVSCSFWNAAKIGKRPTLSFNIMKIVILVPKYSMIIITTIFLDLKNKFNQFYILHVLLQSMLREKVMWKSKRNTLRSRCYRQVRRTMFWYFWIIICFKKNKTSF